MLFDKVTFVGIDPTAGEKPFAYAALDHELRLLALGQGNMDEVLAFTAGQHHAWVSVCAPRRPNLGLMSQAEVRAALSPPPHPGRWENFRLAEYLLRQHNISIPHTPAGEDDCPNWMRKGFALYHRLAELGYQDGGPQAGQGRFSLEVYPHASFTVLLSVLPFPKNSLEGRIQRQLALYDQKVDVPDAMNFFEEITRHRLLKGILPLDELYSPAELDALVGAYTAWLAASHPDQVLHLGDPREGQVVLPAAELKHHYGN
jgi:hypothetical protein